MASWRQRHGWRRAAAALLAVAAAGGLRADEPAPLRILSPTGTEAVFGEVEFVVEASAPEPIARVEFLLDGVLRARADAPPYQVTVDAGQRNAEKRFTAVAHGLSGRRWTATVVTPRIPIDLEMQLSLQQLYVTVTRDGRPLPDLRREDFRVFDGEVEQRLVTFEQGDVPMTLVVLLDASESMRGERLAAARSAALALCDRLQPLDEAMVLAFSDRPLRLSRFGRGEPLRGALAEIEAGGGTALNDHLYAALRLLDARQGRPVVLLLSDGADTLSFLGIEEVVWKTRRSDAILYRLRPTAGGAEQVAFATSWRGFRENRDEVAGLEEAIRASGGRVDSVPSGELAEAIQAILTELRQQYALGYYPTTRNRDGSWRPVRVEVTVPGAWIRTRSGYFDD